MGKLRCRKYISYISSAFIKVLNMLLGGGRDKLSSINFSCCCYNKWQKLSNLQQLAFVTDLSYYTSVGQKWKDFTCLKSRLLAGTFSPWWLWRTTGHSLSIFWKLDSWLSQFQSQQAQPYLSDLRLWPLFLIPWLLPPSRKDPGDYFGPTWQPKIQSP